MNIREQRATTTAFVFTTISGQVVGFETIFSTKDKNHTAWWEKTRQQQAAYDLKRASKDWRWNGLYWYCFLDLNRIIFKDGDVLLHEVMLRKEREKICWNDEKQPVNINVYHHFFFVVVTLFIIVRTKNKTNV